MPRKTDAKRIMEARNSSYGNSNLPSGYVDETTLLLMSQDADERAARRKPPHKIQRPMWLKKRAVDEDGNKCWDARML